MPMGARVGKVLMAEMLPMVAKQERILIIILQANVLPPIRIRAGFIANVIMMVVDREPVEARAAIRVKRAQPLHSHIITLLIIR
jgi:hypothetical protein